MSENNKSEIYNTSYVMAKEEVKRNFSAEDVLYDENRRQATERVNQETLETRVEMTEYSQNKLREAQVNRNRYNDFAWPLTALEENIALLKKDNPEAALQAEMEFSKLFDRMSYSERSAIKQGKKPKVNISPNKSLFSKIKRGFNNFWKPNNTQKQVENQLSELKIMMVENKVVFGNDFGFRDAMQNVADFSRRESGTRTVTMDSFMKRVHKEQEGLQQEVINRSVRVAELESWNAKDQAKLDYVQEVKDTAAQKIEMKMQARENVGITDANANTGIDKLAERAKAMEGMSSEQRLAYRIEQLRGVQKPESKPVQQTSLNPNIMATDNQRS